MKLKGDLEFEIGTPSALIVFQLALEAMVFSLLVGSVSTKLSLIKVEFLNRFGLRVLTSGSNGIIVIVALLILFGYLSESSIDLLKNHYRD